MSYSLTPALRSGPSPKQARDFQTRLPLARRRVSRAHAMERLPAPPELFVRMLRFKLERVEYRARRKEKMDEREKERRKMVGREV